MNILLLSSDEELTAHIKEEANAMGHIVLTARRPGGCVDLGEGASIFVADLRSISAADWKECIDSVASRDSKDKYVVAIVGSGDALPQAESILAMSGFLDDILVMPLSPADIAERLMQGAEAVEVMELGDTRGHDPFLSLWEDHKLMREMNCILEKLPSRIEGMPRDILEWTVRTTKMLDINMHHRKESILFEVLVNRVTETGDGWAADLSSHSFLEIEDEHERLESMFNGLRSSIMGFAGENRGLEGGMDELKNSITAYTTFLTRHWALEEETIFPFAISVLLKGDIRFLAMKFRNIHAEQGRKKLALTAEEVIRLSHALRCNSPSIS